MTTPEVRRPQIPLERLASEAILACIEPFASCRRTELETLARSVVRSRRPAGSVVVRAGQVPDGVFIILRGRVNVTRAVPGGRDLIVASLVAGEIFGESALFDGAAATATTVAATGVELAKVCAESTAVVLEREPAAMAKLARILAERLADVEAVASGLALCDVEQRLRRTLVRMARRQGRAAEAEGWIIAPMPTQSELARMVGSCRETVSRTISAMARSGLVSAGGRRLVLAQRLVDEVSAGVAGA